MEVTQEKAENECVPKFHNLKASNMKKEPQQFKQRRLKIDTTVCFSSHSFLKTRDSETTKDITASSSADKSTTKFNEQTSRKKLKQSTIQGKVVVSPSKKYKSQNENNDFQQIDSSESNNFSSDTSKEEHIYRIIQRKVKLDDLLKKLVKVRQKEKLDWDDFIKDLKNKHGMNSEMETPTEMNTEEHWKPSENCMSIINDLYESSAVDSQAQSISKSYEPNKLQEYHHKDKPVFMSNQFCYPTSSSGRLTVLKRQKEAVSKTYKKCGYKSLPSETGDKKPESKYQSNYPNYLGKKSDSEKSTPIKSNLRTLPVITSERKSYTKIDDTQTDLNNYIEDPLSSVYKKLSQKAINIEKSQSKAVAAEMCLDNSSLAKIEAKLEDLIKSINSLVLEMQNKKSINILKNTKSISIQNEDFDSKTNKRVNFDLKHPGLASAEKYVCGIVLDSSGSTLGTPENEANLFRKENIRLAKAFSSHEMIGRTGDQNTDDYLNDIPTKDISTEVTRSLSRTGLNELKTVKSTPSTNREMAVTTEPLSILGLMRISAKAVRGFLSYLPLMPGADFPIQRLPTMEMSRYVCNICGLVYDKASKLSEHVESSHCSGVSRDCCVCRHVLDMARGPPGLFSCRFCGQRFTRSYCCELHQASCARTLGLKNDVDSRLVLLR